MSHHGPDTADILSGAKRLPLWQSKRTTSLWFCGLLLVISMFCGDREVQLILAGAFALGFQFFMRGENATDLKTRELQLLSAKKEGDA